MDPSTSNALTALMVGDALGRLPLPVQAGVLLLMVACALWAARRPCGPSIVAFVACASMWARANQRMEGAVLITLSPAHGLTVADLLPAALAALVLTRVAAGRRLAGAQTSSRRRARVGQAATVRRACSSSAGGTA
jgi:hypothetical protein